MNNFLPSKSFLLWACIWGLICGFAVEKLKQTPPPKYRRANIDLGVMVAKIPLANSSEKNLGDFRLKLYESRGPSLCEWHS